MLKTIRKVEAFISKRLRAPASVFASVSQVLLLSLRDTYSFVDAALLETFHYEYDWSTYPNVPPSTFVETF